MKKAEFHILVLTILALSGVSVARGQTMVRVGDITRLQGHGSNVLLGQGLVTGLDGSGDGDAYLPAMRALAKMMEQMGSPGLAPEDLSGSKNVAVVIVEAVIPEHGAREGDLIDVVVTAPAAKSLQGGRLLSTPLLYQDPTVDGLFAFARGPIELSGGALANGRIARGARMERDVLMTVVSSGEELMRQGFSNSWIDPLASYITLVLDESQAGYPTADAVAGAVDNADLRLAAGGNIDHVARAMDAKNIVVFVPEHSRDNLASWIREIQRARVLLVPNEARVTINRATKTIVLTGDTRLSPVIVTHAGMTVTVLNPLPDGTVPVPPFSDKNFIPVDVERDRSANVRDLLEALNRLDVPFDGRVAIIEEIHRAGKLHAKLIYAN